MSQAVDIAKNTWKQFNDDKVPQMAASLSYATVFALPPLLMLLPKLVGTFMDAADFRGRIVREMQSMLGESGARLIGDMILQANKPGTGGFAIVGIIMLVVGATGAFVQLQDALNTTWEVKPNPKGGIRQLIFKRILSFGMILFIGFLLLISFVIGALITAFGGLLKGYLGGAGEFIAHVVQLLVGFGVTWLLFMMMFKILPDVNIKWSDVRFGSFMTAILFTVGRFGISLYLGHSSSTSAFGAAAALAVLLIWIYYAALILLIGAEFTEVWLAAHGRRITPEEGAVHVEKKEVVQDKKSA